MQRVIYTDIAPLSGTQVATGYAPVWLSVIRWGSISWKLKLSKVVQVDFYVLTLHISQAISVYGRLAQPAMATSIIVMRMYELYMRCGFVIFTRSEFVVFMRCKFTIVASCKIGIVMFVIVV